MENDSVYSKLGPRAKGRKSKGKVKPRAIQQAKARRKCLVGRLTSKAA